MHPHASRNITYTQILLHVGFVVSNHSLVSAAIQSFNEMMSHLSDTSFGNIHLHSRAICNHHTPGGCVALTLSIDHILDVPHIAHALIGG